MVLIERSLIFQNKILKTYDWANQNVLVKLPRIMYIYIAFVGKDIDNSLDRNKLVDVFIV